MQDSTELNFSLMEDPAELEQFRFWSANVYRDFQALESKDMSPGDFQARYHARAAILCLDMTSFTESAIAHGELYSFLRIFNTQKICGPVFKEYHAYHVRAFADDFTALFESPDDALSAAFEIHRRIRTYNRTQNSDRQAAECGIGIGYGDVYTIGIDRAMGDEMNRSSKLGEDTARGNEVLVTENVFASLRNREDCEFQRRVFEEIPFPFYEVFQHQS